MASPTRQLEVRSLRSISRTGSRGKLHRRFGAIRKLNMGPSGVVRTSFAADANDATLDGTSFLFVPADFLKILSETTKVNTRPSLRNLRKKLAGVFFTGE